MTVDEYIKNQSQDVRATDLHVLRAFRDRLVDKLQETNASEHTGLQEAVQVIVQVLESQAAREAKDPLPAWLAEAAFAAGYLLKRYDLIPNHLPEIGLADDTLILQRVIERKQSEMQRSLADTDLAADNKLGEGLRGGPTSSTKRTK
jgi:uncharacterized membrane protein YkvA (DUF1232 family)